MDAAAILVGRYFKFVFFFAGLDPKKAHVSQWIFNDFYDPPFLPLLALGYLTNMPLMKSILV